METGTAGLPHHAGERVAAAGAGEQPADVRCARPAVWHRHDASRAAARRRATIPRISPCSVRDGHIGSPSASAASAASCGMEEHRRFVEPTARAGVAQQRVHVPRLAPRHQQQSRRRARRAASDSPNCVDELGRRRATGRPAATPPPTRTWRLVDDEALAAQLRRTGRRARPAMRGEQLVLPHVGAGRRRPAAPRCRAA